jgi:hypothetical protein
MRDEKIIVNTAQNLLRITRLARLYVMLQSWFKSWSNSLNSFNQRSIDENLLLLTKKVLVRRKSRTLGGNSKKRENSDELMRPLNDFTTINRYQRIYDDCWVALFEGDSNRNDRNITAIFLKMSNIIFSVMQKLFMKCVIRQRVGRFLHSRKKLIRRFKKNGRLFLINEGTDFSHKSSILTKILLGNICWLLLIIIWKFSDHSKSGLKSKI